MVAASVASEPEQHRGALTICVMLATIMQALDTTIASVALPYMQGSLSATLDQVNWVLTSYIVSAAIMIPLTGWLSDRFGRKQLFLIAVVGFTVTSVLCGLAGSLEQMVVFRLLQGVFGAPLVPLSQVVLLDSYPRRKHGQAMAIWGMGVMVGPILGPTLGAYLTDWYNWRWVFYINLPIGILTFIGLSGVMATTRGNRHLSFDWFGFITLSVAIGALQMVIDRGERLDWFSSKEIVTEAVLSGLFAYLFLVHMFTGREPFIAPALFKDRNFSVGLVMIFVMGVILLATLALLTPFLQNLLGYPIITAGILLAPRGVGTLVSMWLVGRFINQIDPRYMILAGLALIMMALWEMSGFSLDVAQSSVIWTGILQGLGMGFVFVPLSTLAFATLPARLRNQGAPLFNLMRNLGSSIGISVVIFLLSRNMQIVHAGLVEHVTAFNRVTRDPMLAGLWNLQTVAGRALVDGEVLRQAAMIAYIDDFKLLMLIMILPAILLPFLRKSLPRPQGGMAPVPVE